MGDPPSRDPCSSWKILPCRFIPAPDGKMRIRMPPEVGRFSRFTALDILDHKLQGNPVTGKIVIIGF
jgi:CHASE2 domain-containing sensor protein